MSELKKSTGRALIVVIDHHFARLFHADPNPANSLKPFILSPHDPSRIDHSPHFDAEGDNRAQRLVEDQKFYDRIATALTTTAAREILLITHITIRNNAGLNFLAYLKEQHAALAECVAPPIIADILDISDGEILALARSYLTAE